MQLQIDMSLLGFGVSLGCSEEEAAAQIFLTCKELDSRSFIHLSAMPKPEN